MFILNFLYWFGGYIFLWGYDIAAVLKQKDVEAKDKARDILKPLIKLILFSGLFVGLGIFAIFGILSIIDGIINGFNSFIEANAERLFLLAVAVCAFVWFVLWVKSKLNPGSTETKPKTKPDTTNAQKQRENALIRMNLYNILASIDSLIIAQLRSITELTAKGHKRWGMIQNTSVLVHHFFIRMKHGAAFNREDVIDEIETELAILQDSGTLQGAGRNYKLPDGRPCVAIQVLDAIQDGRTIRVSLAWATEEVLNLIDQRARDAHAKDSAEVDADDGDFNNED
jgi:hypothetical protein